jgi:hypothetical protein
MHIVKMPPFEERRRTCRDRRSWSRAVLRVGERPRRSGGLGRPGRLCRRLEWWPVDRLHRLGRRRVGAGRSGHSSTETRVGEQAPQRSTHNQGVRKKDQLLGSASSPCPGRRHRNRAAPERSAVIGQVRRPGAGAGLGRAPRGDSMAPSRCAVAAPSIAGRWRSLGGMGGSAPAEAQGTALVQMRSRG